MRKIILLGIIVLSFVIQAGYFDEKNSYYQNSQLRTKIIKDEIKEMVYIWNEASSNADFDTLKKILADKIEYYQTTVSRDYYIKDQKKFFERNPVYGQVLRGNIEVEQISNKQVRASFIKEVTTKTGINYYPSYLVFEKINGEWKIVLESDLVSDENIRNRKNSKIK